MVNKINISPKKQKLVVYMILTIVTLAVYWQVNQFDFINVDDQVYVTGNSHVQSGITLDGFYWAFSTSCTNIWHPLTFLSYMLDYQFYGLNAGGYHVTNLILHILNTLLLFWLFNRMTGAVWKSAFVAAFFAFHPLHVEAVAWISDRKDILSAFFWMLTLCLYVYYTEKPAIKRYMLVLFCFACALMSKSMVVTLPVIMILLDYWPLRRFESQKEKKLSWQLKEKMPFFILSVAFSIITLSLWHDPSIQDFPLGIRLANASVAFVTYLEKIFWPHNMHLFHPFAIQLSIWQVLGATILILLISAATIVTIKRLPSLFIGWFWYTITILPVIGIMKNSVFWLHEGYTYLPSIGISIILGWGVPLLFPIPDMRKNILFPAGIVALAILAFVSWQQCGYWKNNITLFNHALKVSKGDGLAMEHLQLGRLYFKEKKFEKAIEHFNKTISLKSYYADYFVYNNRGCAYAKLGQYQLAIEDFTKDIRMKPYKTDNYYERGTCYGKTGQYQLALDDFNKVINLKSDDIKTYNNRGIVYTKLGVYKKAIDDFSEAIRQKQDYADAWNNRAFVYLDQGDKISGCSDALKACELKNCNTLEWARSKGLCH